MKIVWPLLCVAMGCAALYYAMQGNAPAFAMGWLTAFVCGWLWWDDARQDETYA